MITGAFVLGIIPLVAAVVKPGTFGGADIKFLAAAGWFFGIKNGVTVMVMGLLASIIGTLIISVVKKEKVNTRHAGCFMVNTKRSSPQEKSKRHSLGICLKSHE